MFVKMEQIYVIRITFVRTIVRFRLFLLHELRLRISFFFYFECERRENGGSARALWLATDEVNFRE